MDHAPDLLQEEDDLLSYFLATEADLLQGTPAAAAPIPAGQHPPPFTSGQASFTGAGRSAFEFLDSSQGTPLGASAPPHLTSPAPRAAVKSKATPSIDPGAALDDSLGNSETMSTSSTPGTDADDRRARRLARNRESARQSRRRKKQYLELLEEKVAQLTEEIDNLRRQHLDAAGGALLQLKTQLLQSLKDKLNSYPLGDEPSEAEQALAEDLATLQSRVGANSANEEFFKGTGSANKKATGPNAASPTATSPTQSEVEEKGNGIQGLWPLFSTELGLTYEQEEKLKAQYKAQETKASKAEKRKLAVAMVYLDRLKTTMEKRTAAVEGIEDNIRSVLTPSQYARYLVWVEENREKLRMCGFDRGISDVGSTSGDDISSLLRKPDKELTLEDVTRLLNELKS